MDTIKQTLKNANLEVIATIMVAVMFGYTASTEEQERWGSDAPTSSDDELNSVLLNIPGLGTKLADRLCSYIGTGALTEEGLMQIPGIGAVRARKVLMALQSTEPTDEELLEAFFAEQVDHNYQPGEKTFKFAIPHPSGNPNAPWEKVTVEKSAFAEMSPYLTYGRHSDQLELDQTAKNSLEASAAGFNRDEVESIDHEVEVPPMDEPRCKRDAWPSQQMCWMESKANVKEAKARLRMFHLWVGAMFKAKGTAKMRKAYAQFRSVYFDRKAKETLHLWMTKSQMQCLWAFFKDSSNWPEHMRK